MARNPWLVSPRYDLTWFLAPGLLAAIAAALLGVFTDAPRDESIAFWVATIVLVDVAHVYSTLYRTYLDPEARRTHRRRLVAAPLLCLWFGALVHLESPRLFWTLLAYLAVFHFIKQHEGFAMLYVRAGRESGRQRSLARWTTWASTAGPVVYWHAHLPREFSWFRSDDFVAGLPEWAGAAALSVQVPLLAWFVVERIRARRAGHPNVMLTAMVLTPALTWNMGIVWFNDDRVFTLTNVVFHGAPYLALVWITGGRDRVSTGLRRVLPSAARVSASAVIALAFYAGVVALAFVEESLWDRLVWHDRPELFGASSPLEWHPVAVAVLVSFLTMPQATHYLLDRWIWRAGPENPRLARQLGFAPAPDRDPVG